MLILSFHWSNTKWVPKLILGPILQMQKLYLLNANTLSCALLFTYSTVGTRLGMGCDHTSNLLLYIDKLQMGTPISVWLADYSGASTNVDKGFREHFSSQLTDIDDLSWIWFCGSLMDGHWWLCPLSAIKFFTTRFGVIHHCHSRRTSRCSWTSHQWLLCLYKLYDWSYNY